MIEILSQNTVYAQALTQALSPFGREGSVGDEKTSLYVSIIESDTPEDEKKDILRRAKEMASFLILDDEASLEPDDRSYFDMVLYMPLRLGLLCKHAQSFYQKKLLLAEENPIQLSHVLFKPKENILFIEDTDDTVYLTEKENHILYYLYQNMGEAVSRDELLNKIWGYSSAVETHTLETHIYRLRQKLEINPAEPKIIVTSEKGYFLTL